MERIVFHFVRSFASAFKARQTLVRENWWLRHELLAAHQSLLQARLERARYSARQESPASAALLQASGPSRLFREIRNCLSAKESRICAGLMLIALLLLVTSGIRCFRSFASGSSGGDAWAELDSFATPAVAEAVLRRDAQSLLAEYNDSYYCYLRSFDAWRRSGADWSGQTNFGENGSSPTTFEAIYGPRPTFELEKWAKRFNLCRASLANQDLAESVDRTLLLLYEQNRRWPEFLDLFLDIARKSPGNSDIVDWAQAALTHSRPYGREDEVLAHLQFAVRFGRPDSVARLTPILQRWNGTRQKAGSPLA